MAASLQYPCHPAMGRKLRYSPPTRFGLKPRKSKCKQCGKIWRFTLTPNGPKVELVGRAY